LLPRHLVSGRNDSAPVLIERLELALLSMSRPSPEDHA